LVEHLLPMWGNKKICAVLMCNFLGGQPCIRTNGNGGLY